MGVEHLSLTVMRSSRKNAAARNSTQSTGASVSLSSLSSWILKKNAMAKKVISRRPSWKQEADISSIRCRRDGSSQYHEEWTQSSPLRSIKHNHEGRGLLLPPIQETSQKNTKRSTRKRQGQNSSMKVTPTYPSTKKISVQTVEDSLGTRLSDACITYHDNILDVITCRIFFDDSSITSTSASYYTVPTYKMTPAYTAPAYVATSHTAPAYAALPTQLYEC